MKQNRLATFALCALAIGSGSQIVAQTSPRPAAPGAGQAGKVNMRLLLGKSLPQTRRLLPNGKMKADNPNGLRGPWEQWSFNPEPGTELYIHFASRRPKAALLPRYYDFHFDAKQVTSWQQALARVGLSAAGVQATQGESNPFTSTTILKGIRGVPARAAVSFRYPTDPAEGTATADFKIDLEPEPAPAQEAPAPVSSAPDSETQPRAGELLFEGAMHPKLWPKAAFAVQQSADGALTADIVASVYAVVGPGNKRSEITPSRTKTVRADAATVFLIPKTKRRFTLMDMRGDDQRYLVEAQAWNIRIIGKNEGVGKPLTARVVIFDK